MAGFFVDRHVKFIGAFVQCVKTRRRVGRQLLLAAMKEKIDDITEVIDCAINTERPDNPEEYSNELAVNGQLVKNFKPVMRLVSIPDAVSLGRKLQSTGFPMSAFPRSDEIVVTQTKSKFVYCDKKNGKEHRKKPKDYKENDPRWSTYEDDPERVEKPLTKDDTCRMKSFWTEFRRLLGRFLRNMEDEHVSETLEKAKRWGNLPPQHYVALPAKGDRSFSYQNKEIEELLTKYVKDQFELVAPLTGIWDNNLLTTLWEKLTEHKGGKPILIPVNIGGSEAPLGKRKVKRQDSSGYSDAGNGRHWVLIFFNNKEEIWCIDPSAKEDQKFEKFKDEFKQFFHKELKHWAPGVLQNEYDCGPFIVEIARALAQRATLKDQYDMVKARAEHDDFLRNEKGLGSVHPKRKKSSKKNYAVKKRRKTKKLE